MHYNPVKPLHGAAYHRWMIGGETILAPGFQGRRPRSEQVTPRHLRLIIITLALSIAVHLVVALMIALLPQFIPQDAAPQAQGAVELLVIEEKGTKPSSPAVVPPAGPVSSLDGKQSEASKSRSPNGGALGAESHTLPAPPVAVDGDEKVPPAAKESSPPPARADLKPEGQQMPASPPAAMAENAPVFDLSGTDSESNARLVSGRVLPAMPDDRFRNRPPVYPREAALRGDHGTVLVVIHVSDSGLAARVDVLESSGVSALDQAAVAAVRKWHFRPAMQDGRAVPFDMPFRFVFDVM